MLDVLGVGPRNTVEHRDELVKEFSDPRPVGRPLAPFWPQAYVEPCTSRDREHRFKVPNRLVLVHTISTVKSENSEYLFLGLQGELAEV